MEKIRFFIWVARINSILFLLLLASSIGFVVYVIGESNKWHQRDAVEVVTSDNKSNDEEHFQLGDISRICGQDVRYVELTTYKQSGGFSSGGYDKTTRNVVFFVGEEMKSHWLFDTDQYAITRIKQLKRHTDKCGPTRTVAIYYEVRKKDTNNDGVLDEKDGLTISVTSPQGTDYQEIEEHVTAVLDRDVNKDGTLLTMLVQEGQKIFIKKYSLESRKYISQTIVTRVGKKT